ncbi:MAG: hypothetical protein AB1457_12830 [Chloroflexota bacterium]
MKFAIRQLLRNLNLGDQAVEIDEKLFTYWLDMNFDVICKDCGYKRFEDAHEKAAALVKAL